MSFAGSPSAALRRRRLRTIVNASAKLATNSVIAPIHAPVIESSLPMMPFCTAFATDSRTTKSNVLSCASSRLPARRSAITRNK